MHTFWQLKTITRIQSYSFAECEDDWPFDSAALFDDSTELHVQEWEWPLTNKIRVDPKEISPATVRYAQGKIEQAVRYRANSLDPKERISAARVVISGVYAYAVDYEYRGSNERIYVCGLSNRVFTERGESVRRGILSSLQRLGYHVANALGNYKPPVDRKYLEAVKSGVVHIGDTRCLLPEVASILSSEIVLNEQGYELTLHAAPGVQVQIGFDFSPAQQSLLCISVILCPIERQSFQKALQLNKRLSFGRIATSSSFGEEVFSMIDRRLYGHTSASSLAKIVKTIAAESEKIIEGKWLG